MKTTTRLLRSAVAATVLGAALVACQNVNFDPDRVCDTNGCISLSKFSANLKAALNNNVVGYVSIVGAVAQVNEYGQARTAADGAVVPMKSDTPMNVASVSKMLTTIGVLQSIKAHAWTIDTKVSTFLPSDWAQGPNVGTITFRELLTHKAGFRNDCNGNKTDYAAIKGQIATGVQLTDKTTAVYNNCNFAIFRELLPFMEGFADPGAAKRPAATAAFYIDYMRQHVFQPAGVAGVADCKPRGPKTAMMYPMPPIGATKGDDAGDWTLTCGGGGWVMTAGELYTVLLSLVGTANLLDSAQKAEMDGNCLGWDCSTATQNGYVAKNGGLNYPAGRALNTYAGVFKGVVEVVVMVNSPLSQNILNLVETAYVNAAVAAP